MFASVIHEFGGPEVLVGENVPDPPKRPGWATVQLCASAINWHDVLVRRGVYEIALPHVMGADGAGIRRDTGEEVLILPSLGWGDDERAPGPGWEILGDHTRGTYAELVSVPTNVLAPRPAGLSWAQAAALPLVGVTAYRALVTRGRLQAGESLLVRGSSGGLATMATSLARGLGANVYVTASSPDKLDRAISEGAAGGVLHTEDDWATKARALTGGRGFDLVLDGVGSTWQDSIRTLRPGGRLVVLGASGGTSATLDVRQFYFGQYDLLGTTMGSPRDFRSLLHLVASGTVAPPPVDSIWDLDSAADAHRALEAGARHGKVVLVP